MDQNIRYYILLEKLTREMVSPEQIRVEAIYEDLQELCKMLRVSKGVTTFYNSLALERRGEGESYTPYDNGAETDKALTIRSELSGMLVGQCTVYHAKGDAPWTEEELSRIDVIQRMMLNFVSKNRMKMMIQKATLYDDAGYSNIRMFTNTVERIGNDQGLKDFCAARIDLKHFSLINQQLGREMSNNVMRDYIHQLEEASGEGGIVSRLGGDNFILLFRKENLDQIVKILEGSPVRFGDKGDGRVMISAHAGVLVLPDDYYYHDFSDLMDRIINAYNTAKNGVRGDVVFSNEEMLQRKEHAMRIKQVFPIALKNEEILVFYQPKINVDSNTIVGAEALSRWYHSGKLVMPMDFIPVLERNGSICELDFYILEHVCRDIRGWLDEGWKAVCVSVNLSRCNLGDPELKNRIIGTIERYDLPPGMVEIEITETTSDVSFHELQKLVSGLREAGISCSMDDFGTGYSSMSALSEIPWTYLKIDKSLVPVGNGEPEDEKRKILIRSIVSMAEALGISCITEGVETLNQSVFLKSIDCYLAQGFFFDRPMEKKEFETRLKK